MEQLLPHLSLLSIGTVEQRDGVVVLSVRVRAETARCGRCQQRSARVHGRYQRRLRDVAIAGTALLLEVRIRGRHHARRGAAATREEDRDPPA
ncbi:transposase family protein [Micromonospora sp. DT233]|uniref:transposase family protein n=1 Tax=Micromonospora sp. DT233 TaxID=3393432 RepID=UPI003CF41F78